MVEFTGERIVPGRVDADLLHEHVSRYRFAAKLAVGKRCLDAGCGLGYGTAMLGAAGASAVGVDVDVETVEAARQSNGAPGVSFSAADVAVLPFPDGCFELCVSFEVIEHLENWKGFLEEIARVTARNGLALISTPNRDYYAASRGDSGPNPFHVHEFAYMEFISALRQTFGQIRVLGQNLVPGICIFEEGEAGGSGAFSSATGGNVADAQFYIAICSHGEIQAIDNFVYLASSGNVLMERAKHIELLEHEVLTKTDWLDEAKTDLAELQLAHEALEKELEERSNWALQSTEALDNKCAELANAVSRLHEAEQTVEERSKWAQGLDAHNVELRERIGQLELGLREATEALAAGIARAETAADQLHSLNLALEDHQHLRHRELSLLADIAGLADSESDLTVSTISDRLRALLAISEQRRNTLELVRSSRWVRLGRRIGVGPDLRRIPL
ncbi:MAG: methyltransferase domain-containing protein [Bryobacterales bacterium]|nr:methyltransferase domain-containing protein [Bryobacterales bacterium]